MITTRTLADILVKHGIVDQDAVEDFEGYDGGLALQNITLAAQDLNDALSKNAQKCGSPTHVKTDTDPGKDRICERKAGHTGKHMTHYGGKRKYWPSAPESPAASDGSARCAICRESPTHTIGQCPACLSHEATMRGWLRARQILALWLEWARTHGYANHAGGIASETERLLSNMRNSSEL